MCIRDSPLTLCLFLLTAPCLCQSSLSCQDESGRPVDWWVLYKLPRRDKDQPSHLDQGVAYVYTSSASQHMGWTLSGLSIEDPGSLPGRTLRPLYETGGDEDGQVT